VVTHLPFGAVTATGLVKLAVLVPVSQYACTPSFSVLPGKFSEESVPQVMLGLSHCNAPGLGDPLEPLEP